MKRQCVFVSAVFTVAFLLANICFSALPEYEIIDLGTLGGGFRTSAYGINDAGQVVGHSWNSDGDERAFLWDSANGMIDLGTLGGSWSWAHAINSVGQVVGYSRTAGGAIGENHAFLWDSTIGMVDMFTVGVPAFRRPWGINDAGQVVGDFGLW
jgi:probable HAF family extracellular repeat protein